MFNYMTPLKGIAPTDTRTYSAEGHDLSSLLYHWLDELLFGFATDFFVPSSLRITSFNREAWRIEAEGCDTATTALVVDGMLISSRDDVAVVWIFRCRIGEAFDRQRHVCGTEIKAITYSAMQINESKGDAEVFVIVDI